MRLWTKGNSNIELYTLDGVDVVKRIKGNLLITDKDDAWLDGHSRGGIGGNSVENKGKLYLILTKILQLDLRRPRGQSRRFWYNITLSKLLGYVPNKNDIQVIKRLLVGSGVIDIKKHHSSGNAALGFKAHAHGYRVNEKYLSHNLIRLYSKQIQQYYFLQKAMTNWGTLPAPKVEESLTTSQPSNKVTTAAVSDVYNDTSPVFKWLKHCHSVVSIDMGRVDNVLNDYLNHPNVGKRITQEEFHAAEHRADVIFNFRSVLPTLPTFHRLNSVRRIACNVNLLNSIIRPCLSYKNKPIHWVDIHACHPFLLLALYKDMETTPAVTKEMDAYYKLWTTDTRDFYRNFAKLGGEEDTHKKLKKEFLGKSGLYSRYRAKRLNYIDKVYRDNFGILNQQIKIIKTTRHLPNDDYYWKTYDKRLSKAAGKTASLNKSLGRRAPLPTDILHSQLAYVNMRREAQAVIDIASNELLKQFGDKSFALTMHDGIGVLRKYVPATKKALRDAFIQVTGKRPWFGKPKSN